MSAGVGPWLIAAARQQAGIAPCPLLQDVSKLLHSRYAAEPLPVASIPDQDYANDEHVNEKLVAALYTITDPAVIRSISSPQELEMFAPDEDEEEEYSYPVEPGLEFYSRMNEEHGTLQRVSVLLEHAAGNPDRVGNFRVYGAGQLLREVLWAATGLLGRDTGVPTGALYSQYVEHLAARKPTQ
ncbi:MAG: hypothetical protein ACQEXN_02240 [Actinomycetota bacterium]